MISETIICSEADWLKWSIDNKKALEGIVAVYGEMGAGKTTAIKQWLRSINSQDAGSSPTFSLVNEYDSPGGSIFHFDFYRISNLEEAQDIGLEDYFDSGRPCWIEWPDKISELLPENTNCLNIVAQSNNFRKVTLETYEK